MNTFIRWGKFNLVGAMGMAVQLGALALSGALGRGPLPLCFGRGSGDYAAAQLCVARALHMEGSQRRLRAAGPVDAISSFKWAGFHGGKSCADENTGGRGAHAAARRELHCDSVLLDY